jgi:hypothetical protein
VKISCKEDAHICRTNFVKKMERNSHERTSWWKMYGKRLFFENLEVRDVDKGLQNVYMAALFGSFGAKILSSGGKIVHNIYGNPNSCRADKLFFLNLYKVYNLYILMNIYRVLQREDCLRSSQPHGQSVKHPLVNL